MKIKVYTYCILYCIEVPRNRVHIYLLTVCVGMLYIVVLKIVNNKSTNCWLVCSRSNVVYSSGAKDCGRLVNQKRLNSFGAFGYRPDQTNYTTTWL